MAELIRYVTIFLGFACLVVTAGETTFALRSGDVSLALRWLGRGLMVVYIMFGASYAIQHHRPMTWITPIAPVAFLLLLTGYAMTLRKT